MTPPLCQQGHGAMQAEPMYEKDGVTVRQHGWFCAVKGCGEYAGPVGKAKLKPDTQDEQMELFDAG